MKLLVIGADGQVGWELTRALQSCGEVIAADRQRCDLTHPGEVGRLIAAARPDVIVNAAAYTAVDRAESDEAAAMAVNGQAVGRLADAAARLGALIVHYSTDYVFDGAKSSAYVEDDPPHPINAYGRSKLAGELALRQAGADFITLRVAWMQSARRQNFLRRMLQLAQERNEVAVVRDQFGAPSFARDIAEATAEIVQHASANRAAGRFESGTFHLAASGLTSWHGFAEAIFAAAQQRGLLQRLPALRAISSAEYPTAAARPHNSQLSNAKLKQHFGIALPPWQDSLARCMTEIASPTR